MVVSLERLTYGKLSHNRKVVVNVVFACPQCDRPARADLAAPAAWQCLGCDHRLRLEPPPGDLAACVVCGNHELFKKKDFPHWLGMTILVGACGLSVVTYFLYLPVWTWAILIGSAAFDGLLYLWVGDAIVCYRCNAHYRRLAHAAAFPPYELTIGERYRQERLRQEQLKALHK